jgi:Putative auto-transporter adhesin, head GIN domain
MKFLSTIVLLLSSIFCFAQKQFVVDEHATVRELSGSFNAIQVSSSIHVVLTKGETEILAVSASNENVKANIVTEIVDGVLKIYYNEKNYRTSYNKQLNVYVSYKNLQSIRASDASNVLLADKLTASSLTIKISDASVLKGEINADTLEVKVSDASVLKLSGVSKNCIMRCNDASVINAYDLEIENAEIIAKDASVIKLTVTKNLFATANDASVISFKGAAVLKQSITRDASIIKHED